MRTLPVITLLLACSDDPADDSSTGGDTASGPPLREGLWNVTPTSMTKNTCQIPEDAVGVPSLGRVTIAEDGTTFSFDGKHEDLAPSVYTFVGDDAFVREFEMLDSAAPNCDVLWHYQYNGVIHSDVSAEHTATTTVDGKGMCGGIAGVPPLPCTIVAEVSWVWESE